MRGTGFKLIYIIIGIIAAIVYLSGSTLKSVFNLKNEVDSCEKKLDTLKTQNIEIARELNWIESTDDYIKYLARKKLGFVEPDEIKFYIVESSGMHDRK